MCPYVLGYDCLSLFLNLLEVLRAHETFSVELADVLRT